MLREPDLQEEDGRDTGTAPSATRRWYNERAGRRGASGLSDTPLPLQTRPSNELPPPIFVANGVQPFAAGTLHRCDI